MASIVKPNNCSECGSVVLHKEWNPEKWVCDKGHVVISRSPKPQTGICRECGKNKNEAPFDKHANICKECKSKFHKNYRATNRERLIQYTKDYWAGKDQAARWQSTRKTIQGSPDAFLRDQMYHIKARSEKPRSQDVKDPVRREFDLDGPFLLGLWEKQGGKCALTGIKMTHQFSDMRAVSIDRIDSSRGHVKGNIQLICQCVNMMKNEHSNDEVVGFLDEYCRLRMKPVLDVST